MTLNEDTTASGNVLTGVTDPDGDTLTATLLSSVTFGSLDLKPTGAWNFTPGPNAHGQTSFMFRVSDGQPDGDVDGTINLTVGALGPNIQHSARVWHWDA